MPRNQLCWLNLPHMPVFQTPKTSKLSSASVSVIIIIIIIINTGCQYFMESVHETDWRLWRKRLGEEVRFVMRMEDIMRHVSNELWNRAWWWTAVWCSLLISIEHGGKWEDCSMSDTLHIETIGCNLETKVRDFLLTIKQWTKHINDQHSISQWHGRF